MPRFSARTLLFLALLALLALTLPASAKTYSFDQQGDWEAFYRTGPGVQDDLTRPGLWKWEPTGGIGDSGRVSISATSNNAIPAGLVLAEALPVGDGSFTLSVRFQWRGTASRIQQVLALGMGKAKTGETPFIPRHSGNDPLGDTTWQQLHLGLALSSETPGSVYPRGGSIVNGERQRGFADKDRAVALEDGIWYHFQTAFEQAPTQTGYRLTATLSQTTPDGTLERELLRWSTTEHNIALTQGEVHPFLLLSGQKFSNISGIDDFVVTTP